MWGPTRIQESWLPGGHSFRGEKQLGGVLGGGDGIQGGKKQGLPLKPSIQGEEEISSRPTLLGKTRSQEGKEGAKSSGSSVSVADEAARLEKVKYKPPHSPLGNLPRSDNLPSSRRAPLPQHGDGSLQRKAICRGRGAEVQWDLSSRMHRELQEQRTGELLLPCHFRSCFLQWVSTPRAQGWCVEGRSWGVMRTTEASRNLLSNGCGPDS